MGFGLTNAPATFIGLMNNVLRPFLRNCVVVFLDDILVFSRTWTEHLKHLDSVLSALEEAQLYCKRAKCEFVAPSMKFLGHIISGETIGRADPEKLQAVDQWSPPHVVTDASDTAIGDVLLQQEDGDWLPVAYTSRRLRPEEVNYTAMERETLAVVHALRVWKLYLFERLKVITDNQGVKYLGTKINVSKREARWIDFLADFNSSIVHRSGKENIADALSRSIASVEVTVRQEQQFQDLLVNGYAADKFCCTSITGLNDQDEQLQQRYHWDASSKQLYLKHDPEWRLCMPAGPLRRKLLNLCHDSVSAGHPRHDRTYARLARRYYWPRMGRFVASKSIVSDRDPRFTAELYRDVFKQLGVRLYFSTANHPQTDGATKRVHRTMGQILRSAVNHRQTNWEELLPMCEFAYSNMVQGSTGDTPFYLNYGQHPLSAADALLRAVVSTCLEAQSWVNRQKSALQVAKDSIQNAIRSQEFYANRSRRNSSFKVGGEVMVHRDYNYNHVSITRSALR
ncbi:uncharacterized protein LOC135824249 [Sycon ciliatum]|uniref:uncharacterized protein LOC135824249 n=1 Tax=Sycon ciliatum TaxID=27933 RepID=UPI0031F7004B